MRCRHQCASRGELALRELGDGATGCASPAPAVPSSQGARRSRGSRCGRRSRRGQSPAVEPELHGPRAATIRDEAAIGSTRGSRAVIAAASAPRLVRRGASSGALACGSGQQRGQRVTAAASRRGPHAESPASTRSPSPQPSNPTPGPHRRGRRRGDQLNAAPQCRPTSVDDLHLALRRHGHNCARSPRPWPSRRAFFDLDRTLMAGSSGAQFGRAAFRSGMVSRAADDPLGDRAPALPAARRHRPRHRRARRADPRAARAASPSAR